MEGVILMGSMFMTDKVKESIERHLSGVPVVMVNGYLDLPNVSGVIVDEDFGVERCVDLLFRKSKKRSPLFWIPSPRPTIRSGRDTAPGCASTTRRRISCGCMIWRRAL